MQLQRSSLLLLRGILPGGTVLPAGSISALDQFPDHLSEFISGFVKFRRYGQNLLIGQAGEAGFAEIPSWYFLLEKKRSS